jgi:hypothetical protein
MIFKLQFQTNNLINKDLKIVFLNDISASERTNIGN